MKLLIMQSSPDSRHFLRRRYKYSPQHPVFKHLNLGSSFNCRDQLSHTYKEIIIHKYSHVILVDYLSTPYQLPKMRMWPILRCYFSIFMEELVMATVNFRISAPRSDSNRRPPSTSHT
jgi:hypothetical protein